MASLRHRGPDDSGFAELANVQMGHARLSVTGIGNGRQPIKNETGDVIAVVNGEFYGWNKLPNHHYATDTDSEHIVHLYEEDATNFVQKTHGEFAFVLYDQRTDTTLAARDRFGIKPLYYAPHKNGWVFASEMQTLIASGIHAELDVESFTYCVSHGYFKPGTTLLKNVRMVKPGHIVRIRKGTLSETLYWEPTFSETGDTEAIRPLLYEAVRKRIPSETKWCCHLSGGLDSSLIAAISTNLAGAPTQCYSIAFEGKDYSELSDAQKTAEFLGANLTVLPATTTDMLTNFPAAVLASGGPANNLHIAAKRMLAEKVRTDGIKVALTGEGSDEIFLGYEHLRMEAGANTGAISTVAGIHAGHTPAPGGYHWSAAKNAIGKTIMAASKTYELLPEMRGEPGPRAASKAWMAHALADYILIRLDDAQNMAFSVESRLPFLDTELARAAFDMSPKTLVGDGRLEKQFLRDAFADILPPWVIAQRKRPFQAPPVAFPLERIKNSRLNHLFDIDALSKAIESQPEQASSAIACFMWSFAELFDHYKL